MTQTTDSPDLTLDEMRMLLAPLIAQNAAFDGWNAAAVDAAAAQAGLEEGMSAREAARRLAKSQQG